MLPLLYYGGRYSLLIGHHKYLKALLIGLAFASVMVMIGTEARTGLIALAALVAMALVYSKSKAMVIATVVVLPLVVYPFTSDAWFDRMNTMSDTRQEESALGRIVVWRWTIDYVSERPLMGGGFNSYLANQGKLSAYSKNDEVEIANEGGKAFHNILIEVLGEHGYVGLLMYLIIIGHVLAVSRRSYKSGSDDWQRWLGLSAFMSTVVYCVGGMFIGVAYLSVALLHVRVFNLTEKSATAWRYGVRVTTSRRNIPRMT